MFREFTFRDLYLATTADRTAAADGIDIHTQATCRIQNWRRARKPAALARRHEDDQGVGFAIHDRGFGRHDDPVVRDFHRHNNMGWQLRSVKHRWKMH